MGWWKSEHGVLGDWPADVMDAALKKIENVYLQECGRLPTQGELADLVEFCTCGVLRPQCGDPKFPFTKATVAEADTPRAAPKGNQGASGCASTPPPGKMANVNPETGEYFDQSQGAEVLRQQFREAQRRNVRENFEDS